VLESIGLWDSDAALAAARGLASSRALPPPWQFHVALGLYARGEPAQLEHVFAAVRAPAASWFRRGDWEQLVRVADRVRCAVALADAPHHHAYQPAIGLLLATRDVPDAAAALRRFLEAGAERGLVLRRAVARWLLLEHGDALGLPLVIEELADPTSRMPRHWSRRLPGEVRSAVAASIVAAALIGGDERAARSGCERARPAPRRRPRSDSARRRVRTDPRRGDDPTGASAGGPAGRRRGARERAAARGRRGVRVGRAARCRAHRPQVAHHLTSAERELGHTRLDGSRIFVSALPLLRREPHGRDIVEGLILHEIGHHVYHRGATEQKLWQQAHAAGIGHLLNLIADEHLERNLRGVAGEYGDRLKRLGAYAFQHAPQELAVGSLLECLRGAAARALIASELGVAFDEAAVRLRRGDVLVELDRSGHALARFARALRMGLGNRHGDPRIAQALQLCGKDLRRLDMRGSTTSPCSSRRCSAAPSPSRRCSVVPRGSSSASATRTSTVQASTTSSCSARSSGSSSPGPRAAAPAPAITCASTSTRTSRSSRSRASCGWSAIARRTRASRPRSRRHAARLRALLDALGLRWEPARARIAGRALDRGRLRALVTRGDPRILMAREPVRRTDLFLGVVIDCSGSMQIGDNLERARRFAVLVSEAVRPLPGVEARFFGFTESSIYDAGDASDCGVTGLEADGGNNDAAALLHAANVAAGSRRSAKLVVMLSDGLPTHCSVAALRALVTTLSRRRGVVCAQVAVRALEEVCFPHYMVLDDDQIDVAVARFGRMIGDLARRALAR
jgi:hypothetical protein